MNQDQIKQAMATIEKWEKVAKPNLEGTKLLADIELLVGAVQRVTRQEERVAERMRCVEIISKIISKSQFIDQFDLLEEAQKLILNQDNE